MSSCAICRSASRTIEHSDSQLEVTLCLACGHRQALHAPPPRVSDYYENTPQAPRFIASLGDTRRRQAADILRRFTRVLATPTSWLDFGSGRGWFLREALSFAGAGAVAGFEASALATAALREEGFTMASSSANDELWPDWKTLPVPPRQISLLDVIEHFVADGAREVLLRLRDELPSLEAVVVKVPVSEGIFYKTARASKAWAPGPYRQLHQVGTFPPHYHTFCRASLRALLEQTGFQIVDFWGDRDVDDLFARIPSLGTWPGGGWAARLAGLFPADAAVAIAKRL